MASLRRHPNSPFWFACFTLPDGRRTQRSTGATDRRQAQRIAYEFEDAVREALKGRFVESRARKTIASIFALANQDHLPSSKVESFLDGWLKGKELEASPKTYDRYATVVTQFKKFLGSKGQRDLSNITAKEITGFRDDLAKRLTPGTVNVNLKILRSAFAQAKRDGFVDVNEAERVSFVKRSRRFERRPFTLPELERVLDVASDEWRGMILVGLYTGQRLGDVAGLSWNNIDLQRGELRMVADKTGRRQIIPLATPLLQYLQSVPAGDDPAAPLFPKACATRQRNKHSGTLSNQFFNLLVSAGLAKSRRGAHRRSSTPRHW